jgi:hypothetical protein
MRFAQRSPDNSKLAQKDRWRRERAAAETLRSAWPGVASVVIGLVFEDPEGPAPAEQSHTMYPPARAFFEFPCPYASCDGKFDLSPVAKHALGHSLGHATGSLECSGVRTRDGVTHRACGVRASYTVVADYLRRETVSGSATRVKSTIK